jgi:hypothetical protein
MVVDIVARGPAAIAGIRGASEVGLLGNLRVPIGADYLLAIEGSRRDRQDLPVLLETKHQVGDR